jgi:hypothetical protein
MPLSHELSEIKAGLLQWETVNWPPQLFHENYSTGLKVKGKGYPLTGHEGPEVE